jgi:predicted RNA-binding protein with PUA-like domain
VARVARGAYADPTAQQGDWSVVDIVPLRPLEAPVSLAAIKGDDALQDIALIKRSRLSVVPVSAVHFKRILKLGGTRL